MDQEERIAELERQVKSLQSQIGELNSVYDIAMDAGYTLAGHPELKKETKGKNQGMHACVRILARDEIRKAGI